MPQASLKGLAIHMVILLKASKNVRSFLAFFDKAKGGKISPPPSIIYYGDKCNV
jgi:hypothetical protein